MVKNYFHQDEKRILSVSLRCNSDGAAFQKQRTSRCHQTGTPYISTMSQKPHTLIGQGFIIHRNEGRWSNRTALKKRLRKLVIANSDINSAYSACDHLKELVQPLIREAPRDPYAPMRHALYFPLLQAAIICYARPFTETRGSSMGILEKSGLNSPTQDCAGSMMRCCKQDNSWSRTAIRFNGSSASSLPASAGYWEII